MISSVFHYILCSRSIFFSHEKTEPKKMTGDENVAAVWVAYAKIIELVPGGPQTK
jgi:hypothetical protein